MQRACGHAPVLRDCDGMDGRPVVPKPNVASLLAHMQCSRDAPVNGSDQVRTHREAASGGFDRNQLILYLVQLNQAWLHRTIFKVKRCCLKNIASQFLPRLRLGEYGLTKGASEIATFLRVANFEN